LTKGLTKDCSTRILKRKIALPKPIFVRISKSNIVNVQHLSRVNDDTVEVKGEILKIGKVFKKYVADQLSATSFKSLDNKGHYNS
jgi:hypothetical protein